MGEEGGEYGGLLHLRPLRAEADHDCAHSPGMAHREAFFSAICLGRLKTSTGRASWRKQCLSWAFTIGPEYSKCMRIRREGGEAGDRGTWAPMEGRS